MIKPTVGRKVWYRPSAGDIAGSGTLPAMNTAGAGVSCAPLDATVVAVWGDRCVNLAIFDIYAQVHERRSVTLKQEGDTIPDGMAYAEWMPYQVGQAKKDAPVAAITSASDQSTEALLQAKGKTAPRITPAEIESVIIAQHFFTAAEGSQASTPQQSVHETLGLLTFCVLVLANGYTVTGESACVSSENFDAEIGRKVARENAVRKIWTLLGYALKQRQFEAAA
jgi:hypothetical protein